MKWSIFLSIACFISCNTPKEAVNANDAKFIFRATVERVGAATLSEISDVSNCIVVKIKEVISAPPGFADWTNRSVTVAVKAANNLKPESEWVFYTNGWLYGKGLAVVEVDRIDSKELDSKKALETIAGNQDKKIKERLKSSEMVVLGQIIKIDTLINPTIISEHDPQWAVAKISADSLLKGSTQTGTIIFRFPTSDDIMWIDAPRFFVGQKGIWLLRKANVRQDLYTITEKEDYYSIENLAYLRSLLK